MASKSSKISPELEKAVAKMLKEVMASSEATITDKMKVIDRALKLEALKAKIDDAGYGSGFHEEDDD